MTERIPREIIRPFVHYHIDTAVRGAPLGNKVSNINIWSAENIDMTIRPSPLADIRNFVETIQITDATGGNPQRDLFRDPLDRTTMTDYDFSKLFTACRAILSLGLKPYIKTGSVPFKFTTGAVADLRYGINNRPPDDYAAYYRYIRDITAALAEEFGREEVRSWRYSVLTEYESIEWFYTPDKNPERSMQAYFALYDTTVAALQDVLGEEVCVGAHAMGDLHNHNKLWNPTLLIEHCASGKNNYTGRVGTRMCFLTISSYEWPMCKGSVRDLGQLFAPFKAMAEKYDMRLSYGVDESRIGVTESGGSLPNSMRFHPSNHIVGHTYQAAYDAQLIKQLVDYDIDYCSAWGYTSAHGVSCKGDAPDCYPNVSFHVANEYHKMCRGNRMPVKMVCQGTDALREETCQTKIDVLASADDKYVYIMAFNFGNSLEYNAAIDFAFDIDLPELEGQTLEITRRIIGDNANFFPEWLRDRERYGILDDCFLRSPESAALDASNTLKRGWARSLYFSKLRDKYVEISKLAPETYTEIVAERHLSLRTTLSANNVVFYMVKMP
ncbi:MAG: hypothetical protein FWD71_19780 [Oscillospiraceae bacterium]|nr:hypothetical protein [Oscillospiraceae bacterium]